MPHVCPACGRALAEAGCKLRCAACGYFEDCGDGLVPAPTAPLPAEPAPPAPSPGAGVPRRALFE